MIPLLVNTIIRAEQVAEAMESKCFGATTRPTRIRDLKFGLTDWLTVALSLAALAALSYHYALTHTAANISLNHPTLTYTPNSVLGVVYRA